MLTDSSGNPLETNVFVPYGEQLSGGTLDPFMYTGFPREPDTGTDRSLTRQYSSAQGRWLAPDLYHGSYNLTDPQTFNRYAYVRNNPLAFTDPSGLVCGGEGNDDCSYNCDVNPDGYGCTIVINVNATPLPDLFPAVSVSYIGDIPSEALTAGGGGGGLSNPINEPKSGAQKQCEDNLFATAIAQGIAGALGVGVPGSDSNGDLASAAKSVANSPAARASIGVIAARFGATLLTGAGAARLSAIISEELIPGIGLVAGAYIGYSAFKGAMSYYDNNVGSCAK